MLPLMSFLNASLLFGAAAFAIPLVIHLLNRSRFERIDWGAMHFLEEALRSNSRRIEWQKWLLLLIRCAIPICLALCMARPLLRDSLIANSLPGTQSIATCIIIDNSLSMEAKQNKPPMQASSLFDLAKQTAIELIESSTRNSRWAVQVLGVDAESPTEISARDVKRHTEFIQTLPHGSSNGDLLASIDEASTKFTKATESQRQIVVLSDFQKSMCQAITSDQITTLRHRFEAIPIAPKIVFLPISDSKPVKPTLDNITIRVDQQTRSFVGIGQPWEIRLSVRNFGNEAIHNARLVLSVDGVATSSKTLDIASQAETQISFGMLFSEARSHRIKAMIETNESLTEDNEAHWSVHAIGTIPVLIVDSKLKDKKGMPESEFLQAALEPFSDSTSDPPNLYHVTRVSPEELTIDKIRDHKIIVLANVPKLNDSMVEPLIERIRTGSILAIFTGDQMDTAWYNSHLGSLTPNKARSPGQEPQTFFFLPFLYDDKPQSRNKESQGLKLRREIFQPASVHFLNEARAGSLESLEVRSWFRLLPNSKDDDESSTTLLSLENGDRFLAQRSFGEGTVLQCATSCNDRWTNWPLRPIFLPMVQQLLLNSTSAARWPCNVETGQPLSFPSSQVLRWLGEEADVRSKLWRWQMPNDSWNHSSTIIASYSGIYTIEGIAEQPLYLAAQAPLEESDLELESKEGLQSLADRLGAQIVHSPIELRRLDKGNHRELWRWFLIGLLVLLFGEILLQRHFSGAAA